MVNQIAIAGLVQGLSEAIAFGERAGLDMKAVLEVIGKGAAQSWQMDNRGKTMIEGKFDFGFAVDWMRKDLGLVLDEARAQRRAPAGDRAGRPVLRRRAGRGRPALGHLEPDQAPALAAAPAFTADQGALAGALAGLAGPLAARLASSASVTISNTLTTLATPLDAARDLGRAVRLALGDDAHQVDDVPRSVTTLIELREQVLRVDQAGLDLGRDQHVVASVSLNVLGGRRAAR